MRLPFFCVLLSFISAYSYLPVNAEDDLINYFAAEDAVQSMKLSPDGRYVAIQRYKKNVPFITISSVDEGLNIVQEYSLQNSLFGWMTWSGDNVLVASYTEISKIQNDGKRNDKPERKSKKKPKKGPKNTPTNWSLSRHIVTFNISTPEFSEVLTYPLTVTQANENSDLVNSLVDDEHHILLALDRDNNDASKVLKLNLGTGELETIHDEIPSVTKWESDRDGTLRLAEGWGKKGRILRVKPTPESEWVVLDKHPLFSKGLFSISHIKHDNSGMYIKSSYGKGRKAIYLFSFKRMNISKRIFSHPKYDVEGIMSDENGEPVAGVFIANTVQYKSISGKELGTLAGITDSEEDKNVVIVDASRDEKHLIVNVESSTNAGDYYLIDSVNKKPRLLASRKTNSAPDTLATTKPITYFSRDGLEIPAYITLPKGHSGEKIPFVIMPHGGPWVRDYLTYNDWVQLIVSMGYGVLQPNFRGSTGYGDAFERSGWGQWGRQMQTDLVDGVESLVMQGLADKDQVCIVGGSYGGYAALVAAAQNKGTYKCAIAFAPVTDLNLWLKGFAEGEEREALSYRVALTSTASVIGVRSPIALSNKMNIPLLLLHGSNDIRVDPKHSHYLSKKLENEKKDFSYKSLPNGSHFLHKGSNRKILFQSMKDFLQQHLTFSQKQKDRMVEERTTPKPGDGLPIINSSEN